jgi:4-amino-4-deoxy-L-arabinose transferase-like glycosyltransferase
METMTPTTAQSSRVARFGVWIPLCTLAACQLLVAAAYFLRPGGDVVPGLGFALLGGLALWAALALRREEAAAVACSGHAALPHARVQLLPLIAGIASLGLATCINLGIPPAPTHLQFALWLLGLVGVGAGLSGIIIPPSSPPLLQTARGEATQSQRRPPEQHMTDSRFLKVRLHLGRGDLGMVALFLILLLAFAVRVVGLGELIRGSIDEVIFVNNVRRLWEDPNYGLFVTASDLAPSTAVYAYLNAGTVALFGRDLDGLRLLNAVLGTLGVLALYVLARALFDRPSALIAALILATFPPHVHFSRIAIAQMGDALFGTLAIAFAVHALKANQQRDWALAGIALGLTQYFYEGGRLLFPALMVGWLALLTLTTQERLKKHRRGMLIGLIAAVICAAPVYLTMFLRATPFTSRLNQVGADTSSLLMGDPNDWLRRFTDPFLVFVHQTDITREFYGGDQPMVLVILVPLFLLGTFHLLWRWRSMAVVIPLWVGLAALGNGLLQTNAAYQRYILVFPALAIVLAVGLVWTWRMFSFARKRVIFTIALLIGAGQLIYYFGVHVPLFNVQFREAKPYADGMDAVLRAAHALPPESRIYIIDAPPNNQLMLRRWLAFLTDTPLTLYAIDAADISMLRNAPYNTTYAFFIRLDDPLTPALLEQRFTLQPPQRSPYALAPSEEYALYLGERRP